MIKLKLQNATEENLKGFGRLVTREGKQGYDVGPYVWYADVAAGDFSNCSFGVVAAKAIGQYPIMSFESHNKTEEFWVPTNGDMIVVLGKPGAFAQEDILTMADLANFQPCTKMDENALNAENFAAFRVPVGSAILLEKSVWHVTALADQTAVDVITVARAGTGLDDAFYGMPSMYGIEFQLEL